MSDSRLCLSSSHLVNLDLYILTLERVRLNARPRLPGWLHYLRAFVTVIVSHDLHHVLQRAILINV